MISDEASSLVEAFFNTTESNANRPAILYKSNDQWVHYSFDEYRQMVLSIAASLVGMGFKKGDKAAILSNNRPEWIITDMGIMTAGAVSVPLYPTLQSDQIHYILEQSESRVVFLEDRDQLEKVLSILPELPKLQCIVIFDPIGADLAEKVFSLSEIIDRGGKSYDQNKENVMQRAHDVGLEDLASIVYTSGTTGDPKGVMLSHGNFLSNAKSILSLIKITPEDLTISILPLSHVLERTGSFFSCFTAGGSRYAFIESLETVGPDIIATHPTFLIAVPRLLEKIYSKIMFTVQTSSGIKKALFNWGLKSGEAYQRALRKGKVGFLVELKNKIALALVFKKIHEKFGGQLRHMVCGGAPLEPKIAEFFTAIGLSVLEGYGLTETSPVTNVNRPGAVRIGAVGPTVPGVQVKIAEDGEILIKGPNVMKGYYKNPEATRESFTEDGWLMTGDIGRVDEEGYLWITDRKKEIIVTSGGKNIAPQPIENKLKKSQFINQVMIVGERRNYVTALIVPEFEMLELWANDNDLGSLSRTELLKNEKVLALIESEIRGEVQNLPRYEQVKSFKLLDELWSTETGELTPTMKLKRKVIQNRYQNCIDKLYEPSGDSN